MPVQSLPSAVACTVILAAAAASSAATGEALAVRSFEVCQELETLEGEGDDPSLLPIERETRFSREPGEWAGPPAGGCGPVRYWVFLDHVRHLSGKTRVHVRVILHAEAPRLVLGVGWPTVRQAEDETGRSLDVAPLGAENRTRMKVPDAEGALDTGFAFDWGTPSDPREPAAIARIRNLRATIPTVVAMGFRPLVTIPAPHQPRSVQVTRNGVSAWVEDGSRSGSVHHGRVRLVTTAPHTAEVWESFSGVPVVLVDASGKVVFQRWFQLQQGEEEWSADIGFTAREGDTPPYALLVYEPNIVRANLPLEWDQVEVPALRLEEPPVPPSAGDRTVRPGPR